MDTLLSIPLADLPVAAIDFESAGAAPGETDQPVQVGIVRCSRLLGAWEDCRFFSSYIACDHPVRWSAAKVHGITTEMLADAPAFPALWPELKTHLSGCCVVGHNPSTEQRFLRAFPGHGFGPWLDTLALSRLALPGLGDYSLSSVCTALGQQETLTRLLPARRWHDALYDALGSLLILRCLTEALNMQQVPLSALPGRTD